MDFRGMPVLAAFLVMLVAIAMIPDDVMGDDGDLIQMSESEEGIFTIGHLQYRILDSNSVELQYILDTAPPYVTVPRSVEYGNTYIVTSLGSDVSAFSDYQSIQIPDTVENIPHTAFFSDTLSEIFVDEKNPVYQSDSKGVLYKKFERKLLCFPAANPQTTFVFPDGVTDVGKYAFCDAVKLEEVVGLPDSLKVLEEGIFYGCASLSKINYHGGENHLPKELIYIGTVAFALCSSITDITLPSEVKVIDAGAFVGCNITTIHLHEGIHTVENNVFNECLNLRSITVDPANSMYKSIDGVLMDKKNNLDTYALVVYPAGKLDHTYTIPEGVNDIYEESFFSVQHLEELVINDMFVNIQPFTFSYIESLETVHLPSSLISINDMAFYGCINLSQVYGGESVSYIGTEAFANTAVTSILASPVLKTIESRAYSLCPFLENVLLPTSLEFLGSEVFLGCTELKKIEFQGDDVEFAENALSVGYESNIITVTFLLNEGFPIPSNAYNEFTIPVIEEVGKRPYPYENLIGVFFCLLILLGIFKIFRQV